MPVKQTNIFLFCITFLLLFSCKKEDKYPSQNLPAITAINPASALPGASITIRGEHLENVTNVRVGTLEAIFTSVTETSIQVLVPDNIAAGNTYVQVYVGNGEAYATQKFTILEAPKIPTITSINFTTAFPGDAIIIHGLNFKNVSVVTFGNEIADYTINDSTKLTVTIPQSLIDAYQIITVSSPTGSDTAHFIVNLAPVINSFAPEKVKTGDTVTVKGYRFNGATNVMLGTLSTSYTVLNDTTLTFTLPDAAATGNISVTTPAGVATTATSLVVY